MMSLGDELGGPERAKAMINAQGVSLILKSIEVQYKRIVTYPDTVRPFSPALQFHFAYSHHSLQTNTKTN